MRNRSGVVLALVAIGWMTMPEVGEAAEPKLCSQTAKAARRACVNGVKDDFWNAVGLCLNDADGSARRSCRRAAKQELKDAKQECGELLAARQDLCDALGQDAYAPVIDPASFLSPEATAASPNPLFPLVPGNTWVYQAGAETITVTVTDETRVIQGVTCIVVRDVVVEDGETIEDTDDYYAQHVNGDVWYMGEVAQNFEGGFLSDLEGSWIAGIEGALAGVIMRAAPVVGETYRQEFALGNAEDAAEVLSVTGSATVPGAACDGTCVVTRDFTPVEPDVEEEKTYAPGIGPILEVNPETGERLELMSFMPGVP